MKQLNQSEKEYVEKFATFDSSLPRPWGRVLGYLLICDPEQQTAAQIKEQLLMSSGSLSAALSALVSARIVQKVSIRGQRAYFYQITKESWIRWAEYRLSLINMFVSLAQEGLKLSPNNRRMDEMYRLYNTLDIEFRKLLKRIELP